MTFHGRFRNGVVVLEDSPTIPEGTPVRVEVINATEESTKGSPRQGGQYARRIWIAPDFDEWPADMRAGLGMDP